MVFEAQWVRCRVVDLALPGLPAECRGLSILHVSDAHIGFFPTNDRALRKAVDWAVSLDLDLVFVTGDMLGQRRGSRRCLDLLARLDPRWGAFAVTGNHEYGLGKGPLARRRNTSDLWASAGITLLKDSCRELTPCPGVRVTVCGADHITGGRTLVDSEATAAFHNSADSGHLAILLVHEPPPPDSPLAPLFDLVFAGHTHGGQIRIPSRRGLRPVDRGRDDRLSGVHGWGRGRLIVSQGLGTSFLPFRFLTRPEATVWRLV